MAADFANRWDQLIEIPVTEYPEMKVDAVFEKVESWHLPDAYKVIVRSQDPKTLKVTERPYKTFKGAQTFIKKSIDSGQLVTFYDEEGITCNYLQK